MTHTTVRFRLFDKREIVAAVAAMTLTGAHSHPLRPPNPQSRLPRSGGAPPPQDRDAKDRGPRRPR